MIAFWDLEQIFIARSFGIRCIEDGAVQYGHADTMTTSAGSCDLLCGRSACITYFLLSTSVLIVSKLWRRPGDLDTHAMLSGLRCAIRALAQCVQSASTIYISESFCVRSRESFRAKVPVHLPTPARNSQESRHFLMKSVGW